MRGMSSYHSEGESTPKVKKTPNPKQPYMDLIFDKREWKERTDQILGLRIKDKRK